MTLEAIKKRLCEVEPQLKPKPWKPVLFQSHERDEKVLHVCLTGLLQKACRKEKVWGSNELLTALKNGAYGFDEKVARSPGGRDGIYILDRDFSPPNEMMRKIFPRFLDRDGSPAAKIAEAMDVELGELLPVRLVSHHMRLLGVIARKSDGDWLILVDCDRTK